MKAGKARQIDPRDVRLFSGSSHPTLAAGIARCLGVPLDPVRTSRFSNDNLEVQLGASVREREVFIVQSLTPPVSDHLLELLMMLDIARGAGARNVHAILPYFSYARSDKKDAPRISITARLIADLLQTAGATHVMTMTLHSPQVHGFFSVPTDPLTARAIMERHFRRLLRSPARGRFRGPAARDTVVVAPDTGQAKPAGRFAAQLDLPSIAADKTRISDQEVRVSELIQRQMQGFRRAIIFDDEIATGSSVRAVCRLLIESGVQEIYIACTHGLFTGGALAGLEALPQVREIVSTDTVPPPGVPRGGKLTVLSVAPLFAEAIRRNHFRESIGDLFTFWED